MKKGESGGEAPAPAQFTWSPELDMQARIFDRLGSILHLQRMLLLKGSGKSGGDSPKPYPRPKTAMAAIEAELRWQQHETLKSKFLPQTGTPVD